jgi:2-dehydro-3-deoxy-L-rhamnonate dehydrogenase (NAD+)
MAEFTDRVAIVTGGARGIGYAAAQIMASRGAAVAVLDLDGDAASQAAQSLAPLGAGAIGLAADVSEPEAVQAAFEKTVSEFDKVDILVNNAGITGPTRNVWEIDPEYFDRLLKVHLLGAWHCIREAVPRMLEQDYGRIVNVASVAGKEGNPGSGGYSAAKAGLIALTKSLAKELATTNVLANAVTPGVIDTEMARNSEASKEHMDLLKSKIPMGRVGRPEEVGELIAFAASDRVTFTTGSIFDASGGRTTY